MLDRKQYHRARAQILVQVVSQLLDRIGEELHESDPDVDIIPRTPGTSEIQDLNDARSAVYSLLESMHRGGGGLK